MDELDFGWGFGVILIAVASLYVLIKGLLIFLIYYLPAHGFYNYFLKTDEPQKNFFRAFCAWAVTIYLLSIPAGILINAHVVDHMDSLIQHSNSFLHFRNMIFIEFVFWRYSFDATSKKLSVVEELNFPKKLVNFILLFLILLICSFFLKFEDYSFMINWSIQTLVYFSILFAFIRIRNIKILKNKL